MSSRVIVPGAILSPHRETKSDEIRRLRGLLAGAANESRKLWVMIGGIVRQYSDGLIVLDPSVLDLVAKDLDEKRYPEITIHPETGETRIVFFAHDEALAPKPPEEKVPS